jgi:hypothetical protein
MQKKVDVRTLDANQAAVEPLYGNAAAARAIPKYEMPRVVVKHGFSHDMADMLIADLEAAVEHFARQPTYRASQSGGPSFRH